MHLENFLLLLAIFIENAPIISPEIQRKPSKREEYVQRRPNQRILVWLISKILAYFNKNLLLPNCPSGFNFFMIYHKLTHWFDDIKGVSHLRASQMSASYLSTFHLSASIVLFIQLQPPFVVLKSDRYQENNALLSYVKTDSYQANNVSITSF